MNRTVWLVSHWQIQPCFFVYDALIVAECVKSVFTMISPHTAFSESAKSHFTGGKMDNGIVDASTAESTAGAVTFWATVWSEVNRVQSQRMRHGLDLADSFVQCLVRSEPEEPARRSPVLHDWHPAKVT